MHKILVPVDGTSHSIKALHIACDIAHKYNAKIMLKHIVVDGKNVIDVLDLLMANNFDDGLKTILQKLIYSGKDTVPREILEKIGSKIMHLAANRVRRKGVDVEVLDLAYDDPAKGILGAQKITAAGTIVMGCSGRQDDLDASYVSVSRAVLEKADCTCIAVK
jgi:nucleotide-binding universal stress UspA family protein